MPESCSKCKLYESGGYNEHLEPYDGSCFIGKRCMNGHKVTKCRPAWCPLQEVKEKERGREMNKKELDVQETVKKYFPKKLIKDLKENERICTTCGGLGIAIVNRVYGIEGDESQKAKQSKFPYKHQAFTFCPECYFGVQKFCKHCGKMLTTRNVCECEGCKKEIEEKRIAEWNRIILNATEVQEDEVSNMLYCEENGKFYADVDEFHKCWINEQKDKNKRPTRLWVTSRQELSIDAASVIADACDDLHEDAGDNCDNTSLQKLLDEWCKEQQGTTTYYPCYEEYIMINWNEWKDKWLQYESRRITI